MNEMEGGLGLLKVTSYERVLSFDLAWPTIVQEDVHRRTVRLRPTDGKVTVTTFPDSDEVLYSVEIKGIHVTKSNERDGRHGYSVRIYDAGLETVVAKWAAQQMKEQT